MHSESAFGWMDAGQPAPARLPARAEYPPAAWPSKDQLTYTKELITCALLVLALPWLVTKLLTDPGLVLSGLGRRAAQRPASG